MTLPDVVRLPPWPNGEQWTRIAWVSERAKSVWEPRLSAVNAALAEIELETALRGALPRWLTQPHADDASSLGDLDAAVARYRGGRSSAMLFRTAEELPALTARAIARGAATLVLGLEGAVPGRYSAASTPYQAGQAFKFRVVVTRDVEQWRAYADSDEEGIGRALGYPDCCATFYRETWVDGRWRDTTLPMHERSKTMGSAHGNILLRWVGVRMVRHLPCSFDCVATEVIGQATEMTGRELGLGQEMDWALEMLSWPVQWSSLHGIAWITTPVFKISTSTDPLAKRAVVDREGDRYPEEGATGLIFPFQQPEKRKVTESRSFARATNQTTEDFEGNGFASPETMELAHETVASVARQAVAATTSILDLGCGNAALLERIIADRRDLQPIGIDNDRARVLSAARRLSHGIFTLGDIFATSLWPDDYGVVLLMPGRLAEVDREHAEDLTAHLRAHARSAVVYVYGDWMAEGLKVLCERFGLEVEPSSFARGRHAEAGLVIFSR